MDDYYYTGVVKNKSPKDGRTYRELCIYNNIITL